MALKDEYEIIKKPTPEELDVMANDGCQDMRQDLMTPEDIARFKAEDFEEHSKMLLNHLKTEIVLPGQYARLWEVKNEIDRVLKQLS
jgi:hypothetical protein